MAEAKLGALRLKGFYAIGLDFLFFFFKPFFKKKKKVVERLSGSSASPLEFRVFHGNYKTAVMENW